MVEKWTLQGNWINSCSCDSGCPCLFYSDPTRGTCDSFDAFHIVKGRYGGVSLDGLNAVAVSHSPGNLWKGNWTAAMYLDKRASKAQQRALETLFGGKAGGPLALIAGLIGNLKGVKWSSISIDPKKVWVKIDDVLEAQLKPTEGGNKKKPIQVSNNPFAPAIDPMNMGIATKSWFKDFGMEWDNTGRDGNWAPFKFSGP